MTYYFTTIDAVLSSLDTVNSGTDPDPASREYAALVTALERTIPAVSAIIMNHTHRQFVPLTKTETFYHTDIVRDDRNSPIWWDVPKYHLHVAQDIAVIDSVTWLSTLMNASEYRLHPANYASKNVIAFDTDSSTIEFDNGTFSNSTDVVGQWYYHPDLTNAFKVVESSVTIDGSSTSLTVGDESLFELYQYLKIEDEILLVTASTTNTLTVERGVLGSTAAAHTAKPVYKFIITHDIKLAATKMCVWLYQTMGLVGNVIEVVDGSVILDAMPIMVKATLDNLKRARAV